jgi:hypothetical protein
MTDVVTDGLLSDSNSDYVVTLPDVSVTLDNASFDVQSGASLSLTGSSDTVIVENGAQNLVVAGSGDVVVGSGASGVSLGLSGTGNQATLGANALLVDEGSDDTITIGANGEVDAQFGAGSTINATQGGDSINLANDEVANADNDQVSVGIGDQVNGNGNQIQLSGASNTLSGANNSILIHMGTVTTATVSLTEAADGSLVLQGSADPSSVTLTGGVATVQLGNGNVATIDNVSAGTQFEYINTSGAVTWSVTQDSGLTAAVSTTFDFGAGSGQQSINAVNGALGAETGAVDFAAGVSDNQLWFEQVGNNLQIDILGTHDSLSIDGWYGGSNPAAQSFQTTGGSVLDTQVNQLASAMATYSATNPGFDPMSATQMPTDPSLQIAIAASWHH